MSTFRVCAGATAALMAAFVPVMASAAEIEFWTTETQSDRVKTIQLLIDTFEALNPDTTVKLVPVEDNDTAARMAAASAAGTLPNIVITESDLVISFGQEGLLDTKRTTELVTEIGAERFQTGALRMLSASTANSYYAIPHSGWILGLWYRTDWFEAAGLEPPTTWDRIAKAAEYFYKPDQNRYGILIGTDKQIYTEQVFTQFALSNGVTEFDNSGQINFNSPATVETLSFYSNLAKFGPAGPQYWRARDYYLQGRLAMFFYSTFIMDDLALAEEATASLTSENFSDLKGASFDPNLVSNTGVVTTLRNTTDASSGSIQALGILNSSDQEKAEATSEFVKFLFDPSSYITWLHMSSGGFFPTLRDVATSEDYLNDPKGLFERYGKEKVQQLLAGFESLKSFAVGDGRSFPEASVIYAKGIIPRMVYSTIFEGKSPADAVAAAEGEMRAVLNR